MNTNVTEVTFQSVIFIPPYVVEQPTTAVWTGGNTVLTCTPSPAFPANAQIIWSASGENLVGDSLDGTTTVFSRPALARGGGGSGTNAITTFSVGKVHPTIKRPAALPTLDPTTPYGFSAVTGLCVQSHGDECDAHAANPTAVSNLVQIPPTRRNIHFGYQLHESDHVRHSLPGGQLQFLRPGGHLESDGRGEPAGRGACRSPTRRT